MYVNTVSCIFTMFIPAGGFIIKVYFPNLDRVGYENFFVKPRLHEQILFDKFHMSKIFCSCR